MIRFLACVLLLLCAGGAAHAIEAPLTPQTQFTEGNAAYEKGDIDGALQIYQGLTRQGFESAALYYNLGNVYYRRGERGKAVLWYERAQNLAPRDTDIAFNLTLAKSHLKDNEDTWIEKGLGFFTPNELGTAAMIFLWIFFGLVGASTMGWLPLETWNRMLLSLSGIFLLVSASWFGVSTYLSFENEGIVVAPPGEVRNGPGQDYAVGFTVPEGTKVNIMNRRPDWIQIGVTQQGLKGWIPAAEVESIGTTSASSS
jgi:hypothetical protein